MIDIESKIISFREDTNDYRLCLTREEIDEIKNVKAETIGREIPQFAEWVCKWYVMNISPDELITEYLYQLAIAEQLKEQKK